MFTKEQLEQQCAWSYKKGYIDAHDDFLEFMNQMMTKWVQENKAKLAMALDVAMEKAHKG